MRLQNLQQKSIAPQVGPFSCLSKMQEVGDLQGFARLLPRLQGAGK
jgi:hypothetical protein